MLPHYFNRHPVPFCLAVISIFGFLIYCHFADKVGGGTDSFWVVMCRVTAKHVKLAITFSIGFLFAFFAIMSVLGEAGAYSKSMTIYGKGPKLEKYRSLSGRVWHEVALFLAPFALLICIVSSSVRDFYLTHMTPCNLALFGLYLVWLWFTVRAIVQDEYTDDNESKRTLWSVAAFGTWVAIVLTVSVTVHAGGGVLNEETFKSRTQALPLQPEKQLVPENQETQSEQPKDSAELAVRSLLSTWIESFKEKDLARQMDCYAPVMQIYFLQHNVSRDFVQTDKLKAFTTIVEIRSFEISRITIEFSSSSNATVRFMKRWDAILASDKRFAGEEIEELQVANLEGGWKIASEREVLIKKVAGHLPR